MNRDAGAIALAFNERRKKKRDWRGLGFQAVFLLPAVAFLAIFMYYPIEETFRLSLMRATGLGDTSFIWFENYVRLFASEEFRAGLAHVFAWAFWSVVIQIPLAFSSPSPWPPIGTGSRVRCAPSITWRTSYRRRSRPCWAGSSFGQPTG